MSGCIRSWGLAVLTIDLPWPSADLNPNGRVHHMALHRARKSAKTYAWGMTLSLMRPLGIAPGSFAGRVQADMVFHPLTNARRDVDNLIASMKAQLDGIAAALGIDDSAFDISGRMGEKRAQNGVIVTLTPALISLEKRGVIR